MRKHFSVLLLLCTLFYSAAAQDIITLKSGDELKVKIIRLNPKDVTFTPRGSKDTITIWRDDVLKLWYQSGTTVYLSDQEKPDSYYKTGTDSLYDRGVADASKYYQGYKNARTGTIVAALIFPFNLIPAIACSATSPSDENLDYRDKKLMQDPAYSQGYTEKAHKIKKRKVWEGYFIGTAGILVLYFLVNAVAVTAVY